MEWGNPAQRLAVNKLRIASGEKALQKRSGGSEHHTRCSEFRMMSIEHQATRME
tara:strand:+ start:191 stop:352 length:162 start_codon:yes stop_codon:yes gene_type:complete